MDEEGYMAASGCIGFAVGGLVFLCAWAWSVSVAGFLGFLLGWIPALIAGFLVGLFVAVLWPLLLIAAIVGGYFIWRAMRQG